MPFTLQAVHFNNRPMVRGHLCSMFHYVSWILDTLDFFQEDRLVRFADDTLSSLTLLKMF